MAATKVTLKLLIDQTTKKVLFAEAGKDFVDFLFTILTLPVGTVVTLLGAKKMVGSLGDLYESIETLSSTYMQPNQTKATVLKPRAPLSGPQSPLLLPKTSYKSSTRNFYKCVHLQNQNESCFQRFHDHNTTAQVYVAEDPTSECPSCKKLVNSEATYVAPRTEVPPSYVAGDEGGFVRGVVTYMVMDDLVVKPMSTISSITMLNQFHVEELGTLEEKVVELGIEEGMELLRASLKSKTVLTDVFIPKI